MCNSSSSFSFLIRRSLLPLFHLCTICDDGVFQRCVLPVTNQINYTPNKVVADGLHCLADWAWLLFSLVILRPCAWEHKRAGVFLVSPFLAEGLPHIALQSLVHQMRQIAALQLKCHRSIGQIQKIVTERTVRNKALCVAERMHRRALLIMAWQSLSKSKSQSSLHSSDDSILGPFVEL